MKISGMAFSISLLIQNFLFSYNHVGVTYDFSGGRFGDNLVAYLHAKWTSFVFQIPLFYKPFKYSSELALDANEVLYNDSITQQHPLFYIEKGDIPTTNGCLLVLGYYPESICETRPYSSHLRIDWGNKYFRELVRQQIKPKKELSLIHPPSDSINIAIHIREGGGVDNPNGEDLLGGAEGGGMKILPLNFYVEGLRKVLELFDERKVYCYIFTDAHNPTATIIEKIKSRLNSDRQISFDCRTSNTGPENNVLEDFFSLCNFDVLIRSESNFSIVPSLLHDFAVLYSMSGLTLHEDLYRSLLNSSEKMSNPR